MEGTPLQMQSKLTSDERGLAWSTRRARAAEKVDQRRERCSGWNTRRAQAQRNKLTSDKKGSTRKTCRAQAVNSDPRDSAPKIRRAQAAVLALDDGIVSMRFS